MYGTQDASNAWQKLWGDHLRNNGFELGASNPALYKSELVNGYCHGDDFVTAAAEDQVEIFEKLLQEKFDTTDWHDWYSKTSRQSVTQISQSNQ